VTTSTVAHLGPRGLVERLVQDAVRRAHPAANVALDRASVQVSLGTRPQEAFSLHLDLDHPARPGASSARPDDGVTFWLRSDLAAALLGPVVDSLVPAGMAAEREPTEVTLLGVDIGIAAALGFTAPRPLVEQHVTVPLRARVRSSDEPVAGAADADWSLELDLRYLFDEVLATLLAGFEQTLTRELRALGSSVQATFTASDMRLTANGTSLAAACRVRVDSQLTPPWPRVTTHLPKIDFEMAGRITPTIVDGAPSLQIVDLKPVGDLLAPEWLRSLVLQRFKVASLVEDAVQPKLAEALEAWQEQTIALPDGQPARALRVVALQIADARLMMHGTLRPAA
jgi:hypothetical protein